MIIDRSPEFFSLISSLAPSLRSPSRAASPLSAAASKPKHSSQSPISREIQSLFHALTQLRHHMISSLHSYIGTHGNGEDGDSSAQTKPILLALRRRLDWLQQEVESMQLSSTFFGFSFVSFSHAGASMHQLKGELECLEYKYGLASQLWMCWSVVQKERTYYFQLFRLHKRAWRKSERTGRSTGSLSTPKQSLAREPDTNAGKCDMPPRAHVSDPSATPSTSASVSSPSSAWSDMDPALLQTLEQEQVQLFASQPSQLSSDIQDASQSLFGISELQHILSTHLSGQAVLIDQLYEASVEAESMVNRAYEELKKAMATPESSYRLATIVLVILSLSLLFLDWYD